ncbi:hypothetical protein ACYX79_14010 [Stenotrophomonas rhizophila]|uniref:Uncharacterized protein n=1 Tax=Stenotrophomonas rhizophila TaxID=216778 RepID=A0AAW5PDA0_9GAMM|nr:hypothetical protein [Stenotrophomonas rhizophila]MBU2050903.1 hypothetical protein [Gammaproteobacteria bacterium]MCS4278383.1 hypothetical protein [Stenotrophomonas rhizophila]
MSEHRSDNFQHLKGKHVTLTFEDEQVQVGTDDGWMLHIYNTVELLGAESAAALAPASFRLKLLDCVFDQKKMTLFFTCGKALIVDMTDDGYSGPEAMQLNGPDGSIMIWN